MKMAYFGMLRRVVWNIVTDVLKVLTFDEEIPCKAPIRKRRK
jgi:hypothetical protein